MFLRINIDLEPIVTEELETYVKAKLPAELNEALFQDKNYLDKVIKDCVKSHIKSCISEMMQGRDFRNFLRDKIADYIGLEENANE